MVFIKIQFTHLQSDSFQTTLKAQQNHTPTQSMTTPSIKKKEQNQLDRLAEFQLISGRNFAFELSKTDRNWPSLSQTFDMTLTVQNCSKLSRTVTNGPKMFELTQTVKTDLNYGPIMFEMSQTVPKWPKLPELTQTVPIWLNLFQTEQKPFPNDLHCPNWPKITQTVRTDQELLQTDSKTHKIL